MHMTPLMRRFTTAPVCKRMAVNRQFGAVPDSTMAAPVFLAHHKMRRFKEENHAMALDVSKAFDTAPHGALALLLRHMGVQEELQSGHCHFARSHPGHPPPSRLVAGQRRKRCAVSAPHGIPPAEASQQGPGDKRHAVPLVAQAYVDNLVLIAHALPQFLKYAEAISRYLADMGMFLNVCKGVYATTTRMCSIMVDVDQDNAVAPWVCLVAKGHILYLGLRLDPTGMASLREKYVLCSEALVGRCKNTLGPASVPHEVMAAVVGGIVQNTALYLSDATIEVVD